MYLNSFCSISPAGVLTPDTVSSSLQKANGTAASCIEPDYKELIPPMQLRRMTKPVRTGVAAAKICMQRTGNAIPSSIHVGTAYGMLQDSENFLQQMIVREEQMLNPTAFIQSTHNTVAGQIALSMGCNAHNMTFVHKVHSFESALLDISLMPVQDGPVLAGAVDEGTETSYAILKRFGVYDEGYAAGEGASFFLVSGIKSPHSLARIRAFDMFVAEDADRLDTVVQDFCHRNAIRIETGDGLLNGIPASRIPAVFKNLDGTDFKAYCGEFPTAAAFALAWATINISEQQKGRYWILNGNGRHYSIYLVEAA